MAKKIITLVAVCLFLVSLVGCFPPEPGSFIAFRVENNTSETITITNIEVIDSLGRCLSYHQLTSTITVDGDPYEVSIVPTVFNPIQEINIFWSTDNSTHSTDFISYASLAVDYDGIRVIYIR